VASGSAAQVRSKRKQLGVLACSVTLHKLNSRYAATRSKPTGHVVSNATYPVGSPHGLRGAISHLYSDADPPGQWR
jgi:hypothetical protein